MSTDTPPPDKPDRLKTYRLAEGLPTDQSEYAALFNSVYWSVMCVGLFTWMAVELALLTYSTPQNAEFPWATIAKRILTAGAIGIPLGSVYIWMLRSWAKLLAHYVAEICERRLKDAATRSDSHMERYRRFAKARAAHIGKPEELGPISLSFSLYTRYTMQNNLYELPMDLPKFKITEPDTQAPPETAKSKKPKDKKRDRRSSD